MYKVLITSSGIGSRLKKLTKTRNKALIEIAGKPVISYILDSYPEDREFVITLGYMREELLSYIKTHYPKRHITPVVVDLFDGPGSSLGFSMLAAEKHLQCPFIFHCNDTIVTDAIPGVYENWNGGSKGLDRVSFTPLVYSSFTTKGEYVKKINPKGATEYDFFHIGLVGIKNYKAFWRCLHRAYEENPRDETLNDVAGISQMLQSGYKYKVHVYPHWFDTGNLRGLSFARNYFEK